MTSKRCSNPSTPRVIAPEQRLNLTVDSNGASNGVQIGGGGSFVVSDLVMQGDASTLTALGATDPNGRAAAALLAGKALVSSPDLVVNGMVTLVQYTASPTGGYPSIRLPAQVVEWGEGYEMPAVLLSERVVKAHHITVQASPEWRALFANAPSTKQAAELRGAAPDINADVSIELGYRAPSHLIVLALLLVSLLFSLGVTAVATALASADARPDLAVLAAGWSRTLDPTPAGSRPSRRHRAARWGDRPGDRNRPGLGDHRVTRRPPAAVHDALAALPGVSGGPTAGGHRRRATADPIPLAPAATRRLTENASRLTRPVAAPAPGEMTWPSVAWCAFLQTR